MNEKIKYLVNRFKDIFPWTSYLILKPVLVDENGNKIWFDENKRPNTHYTKKIFIGINQLASENCCIWFHRHNDIEGQKLYSPINYEWKDYNSIAISYEDLYDEKNIVLVSMILKSICLALNEGDTVTTYRGVIFNRQDLSCLE